MGFIEKVTGSDQTKRFKEYDKRIKELPKDYQDIWKEMIPMVAISSKKFTDIMETILLLFEESASDGQTVNEVIGEDVKGFCNAITGVESTSIYRDKWRKQLNKNVKEKLSKLEK